MGNINNLFTQKQEVTISRVTGFGSSGEFKVSIGGVIRRVNSAVNDIIKIGDTVLLNKTPHGKFYIVGKTTGLGNSKNIMEVFKNG
jgi:hypothetical protein